MKETKQSEPCTLGPPTTFEWRDKPLDNEMMHAIFNQTCKHLCDTLMLQAGWDKLPADVVISRLVAHAERILIEEKRLSK